MHSFDLILTLTGGLAAALVFGYVTQRLGRRRSSATCWRVWPLDRTPRGSSPTPPLAEQLAEVGVILLMSGAGLQFHVEELLNVRRVALPGAIAQSAPPRWSFDLRVPASAPESRLPEAPCRRCLDRRW
jgi:CPA2 family monovalent cation:H+ antiporter-2